MGLVSTNKIDATKYELIINVDAEGFEKALQNASNPVFAYGFLIVFIIFLALRAFHILPMP